MARNTTGFQPITAAMGGLIDQINHHLVPSMPRPNLRRPRGTIRGACQRRAVTSTETSLIRSYSIVTHALNRVWPVVPPSYAPGAPRRSHG
jgi:hypothetical protein